MAEGRLMVSVCMISEREYPSVSVMYASTDELRSSGHNLGNNKRERERDGGKNSHKDSVRRSVKGEAEGNFRGR